MSGLLSGGLICYAWFWSDLVSISFNCLSRIDLCIRGCFVFWFLINHLESPLFPVTLQRTRIPALSTLARVCRLVHGCMSVIGSTVVHRPESDRGPRTPRGSAYAVPPFSFHFERHSIVWYLLFIALACCSTLPFFEVMMSRKITVVGWCTRPWFMSVSLFSIQDPNLHVLQDPYPLHDADSYVSILVF